MALNCPIFTRILHDYLYLNNKLRTFSLFGFFMGQYCPIFTRILHDYLYLNNKLRTFSLFCFFISHFTNTYGFSFEKTDNIFANCIFVRIREIFKTNRETWRSARKPGDSRVNRETWQLCLNTLYKNYESKPSFVVLVGFPNTCNM